MEAKPSSTKKATDSGKVLSVFGYTDYRAYLRDYYEYRKESQHGFSFRAFSLAAGFSSPNFLKLVIDGERNISPEATHKFIKGLGLKTAMAEYFDALVRMNQAKSDAEKDHYFGILRKLTPSAKRRELNAESHKYLSHWIYPTLREMAVLPDFREDPYWIARRLVGKVSVAEITQALQFLVTEGFLEKKDGRYHATDNLVLTSDEVRSLGIRNFHRQMLDQAKEALESLPMEEREYGALTVTLPESALQELKFKMKVFRRELHQWAMQVAADSPAEQIVQINMQMHPLVKKV